MAKDHSIRLVFSLILPFVTAPALPGALPNQSDQTPIQCYTSLNPSMEIIILCNMNGNQIENHLSGNDFLHSPMIDSETGQNYTIANYPSPIFGFAGLVIGNVSFDGNALNVFPNITDFTIQGDKVGISSIDISPPGFSKNHLLKTIRINHIFVSENSLKSIGASCPNVETFEVNVGVVKYLKPEMFDGMKNLANFALRGNSIEKIETNAFRALKNLQQVTLDDCEMEQLPLGLFDNSPKLEMVQAYSNRLETLPVGLFRNSPEISSFTFDANRIKILDADIFKGLTNLTELRLFYNKITNLPDGLFNGTGLVNLVLSDNQITRINRTTFAGLTNLVKLDLADNQIDTIEPGAFDDLVNLRELRLRGNPIQILPDGRLYCIVLYCIV